jgi:hypothetical protein
MQIEQKWEMEVHVQKRHNAYSSPCVSFSLVSNNATFANMNVACINFILLWNEVMMAFDRGGTAEHLVFNL